MKTLLEWLNIIKDIKEFFEDLTPDQKASGKRILIRFATLIGLGSAFLSYIALTGVSNATNTTLVAGQPADTKIMVPSSPSTKNALEICEGAARTETLTKGTVHVDGGSNPEVWGYKAVFGAETLTYTDNPPGGKNLQVILNGTSVTVPKEVVECLIKRAK